MRKTASFFRPLFSVLILATFLLQPAGPALCDTLEAEMNSELQRISEKFAKTEPQRGQYSDNKSYEAARNKWQRDFRTESSNTRAEYKARDTRFKNLNEAIKSAGMEGELVNTGSKPKTPASDMDLTTTRQGAAKELAQKLNKQGYSLQPDPQVPGRYIDPSKKLVVWDPPPNMKTGSPEWRNWMATRAASPDTFSTPGGLHETSGGRMGAKDPAGAVLDNVKKAMEAGITKNPATGEIDSKTLGKSVKKAMEWTDSVPKKGEWREFARQAERLRQGASWEEAGITSPNDPPDVKNKKIQDWQNKAQDSLANSNKKAQRQSQKLTDQKVKELTKLLDKKGPMSKADTKKWNRLTDELHAVSRGNGETMRHIAETNPELAGKVTKQPVRVNPDGTVTDLATGKTMTRSQYADKVAPGTQRRAPKVVKPELPKKTPEPIAPKPVSRITKYGGGFLLIYQGYEAGKAYSEYLDNAARNDPENFGYLTVAKGLGYGVATFLGIPGLIRMGEETGQRVRKQYEEDLRQGKKWLLPPSVWGGMAGAWAFGRSIFIDPLIAGGEAVIEFGGIFVDLHKASKAARDALEMKNALDERYRPLSELMSHIIGGPLPPIWEKNRFKYYQIFKPILDDKEALEKLMKTPAGTDLLKWAKEYKEKRAKELGITFGSPGADNPDDNDNIGEALMALSLQERVARSAG